MTIDLDRLEALTPFAFRRLNALHVRAAPEFGGECADVRCDQKWPCDVARLIAEVRELRGIAEAARDAHLYFATEADVSDGANAELLARLAAYDAKEGST